MPVEDLGYEAAELLTLSNGEVKSLRKLAELAVRQVPGCAAAHAVIWRGGELAGIAATHPDTAELAELQIETDDGPLITSGRAGQPVSCPDTLAETRWPQWTEAALCRGVRSYMYLARRFPQESSEVTIVLALFGVRPGALDTESVPIGEMLTRFGGTVVTNTLAYGAAQRTAIQLKDSVAPRAITDQAKGILMHALGCDAEEALAYLRRESQQRHVKVTEVAAGIIQRHKGGKRPRP